LFDEERCVGEWLREGMVKGWMLDKNKLGDEEKRK
jgi:hypothetical protein